MIMTRPRMLHTPIPAADGRSTRLSFAAHLIFKRCDCSRRTPGAASTASVAARSQLCLRAFDVHYIYTLFAPHFAVPRVRR